MAPAKEVLNTLGRLKEGNSVAVLTLVGSLCPVTTAHVACVVETRKLVMNEPSDFQRAVPRPKNLQIPNAVVGCISVNSDSYVHRKLGGQGFIQQKHRRELIDMASKDMDWLFTHDNAWKAVDEIRAAFPHLNVLHFEIDGADVAVKGRKWRLATAHRRFVAIGRPPSSGDQNGTEAIIAGMECDRVDRDLGHFILGPELPDISSSKVREALRTRDMASLHKMLHPDVLAWILKHGPYAEVAAAGGGGAGGDGGAPPAAAGPAAAVEIRRGTPPFSTLLRAKPTDSRAEGVWTVPAVSVADGEAVTVVDFDQSGRFALISTAAGAVGWVQRAYIPAAESPPRTAG